MVGVQNMEENAKSTNALISANGKKLKIGLLPKCLSRTQVNIIKISVVAIIIYLALIHFLPRALELAPDWVKHFFSIYIFLWGVPRLVFKTLDSMKKE